MSPILLLTVAFALGIWIRESLGLPALLLHGMLVVALGSLGWAWRCGRGLGLASLGLTLVLGGLSAAAAWPEAAPGLLDGTPWTVRAEVVEAPEVREGDAHVLLELVSVARDGLERRVQGRVWLRLGGPPHEPLAPGDGVLFRATLRPPRGLLQPDMPDPARRLATRGVVALAGVAAPDALVRLVARDGEGLPPWRRVVASWRARLDAALALHVRENEARALLASLVLGRRTALDGGVEEAFRRAGVSHVLSVSGLHLAIVALLVYAGLRRLLVRVTWLAERVAVRRVAAVAVMPLVLGYTLLTGAAVATVRACVMTLVSLLGVAVGRPSAALGALAVATLALLGAMPLSLYDPSLQLSVVSVLGIVGVAPHLVDRAHDVEAGAAGRRKSASAKMRRAWRGLRVLLRWLAALWTTSLVVFVLTAPIAAWHFAQVAPAALVANMLVVPLAELWVLPLGALGTALALLSPSAGGLVLGVAEWGARMLLMMVRAVAALPLLGEPVHVRPPTLLEALLWLAATVALLLGGRHAVWRRASLGCALALAVLAGGKSLAPRLWPALTVTFFDIGQGDAALVELPSGMTMLVDGGGSFDPRYDPGQQVLVPWLERHGVRRLDVVVLTHPHPDHANGLASVVTRFPVGEVWTNGVPSSLPGLRRLEEEAAHRSVKVVRPHALRVGDAAVEVLHPLCDGRTEVPAGWSENDGSIVVRIRYRGRAVLLTGDIEARAEHSLVASGQPLAADVIKAPHHGSPTSSTPALVGRVWPKIVVYSVGAENRWGFPSPRVDVRWREAGATTLRTDRDGAVTVRIHASGALSVETARSRSLR